jgi:hypothetical protein
MGPVARIGEMKNVYKIMVGKPEWKHHSTSNRGEELLNVKARGTKRYYYALTG